MDAKAGRVNQKQENFSKQTLFDQCDVDNKMSKQQQTSRRLQTVKVFLLLYILNTYLYRDTALSTCLTTKKKEKTAHNDKYIFLIFLAE